MQSKVIQKRSAKSIYSRKFGTTARMAYFLRNGYDVDIINAMQYPHNNATHETAIKLNKKTKLSSSELSLHMNKIGGHVKLIRKALKKNKKTNVTALLGIAVQYFCNLYKYRTNLKKGKILKLFNWGKYISKVMPNTFDRKTQFEHAFKGYKNILNRKGET